MHQRRVHLALYAFTLLCASVLEKQEYNYNRRLSDVKVTEQKEVGF